MLLLFYRIYLNKELFFSYDNLTKSVLRNIPRDGKMISRECQLLHSGADRALLILSWLPAGINFGSLI